MRKIVSVFVVSGLLSGCAQKAENISASYTSPLVYQDYTCKQLRMELARISRKVTDISGAQNKQASGDAAALGIGLVLFWPALFFMIGDDKKEELAHLKGEYEALEEAAIQKECDVSKEIESARAAEEARKQSEIQQHKGSKANE